MAKDHLLLREAHRFPADREPAVTGWRYRRDWGAWVDGDAPDLLMVVRGAARPGEDPNPNPPRPTPTSKKSDRETGEVMKGA